jgi:nicotinamide mononucleotide transporter
MLGRLAAAAASLSPLEAAAVVLAIAYLILAIRQSILCWWTALVSSLLYVVIFMRARLYMESAVNVFYAAMAVYGWYEWRFGGARHEGVRINVWPARYHAAAFSLIAASTLLFGLYLSTTSEASPFVDSFTTVGAVVTTFMVARKVLENWIYWLVIDSVEVYLFVSRELYLTALLFVVYLVLVVIGFRDWLKDYRAVPECQHAAC